MFRKKVQAAFDKAIRNSNSWDYLPAKVKDILRSKGYKKTDFTASAVPGSSLPDFRPFASFAILRCKPGSGGLLTPVDLEAIFKCGVVPTIDRGVLALQLEHEDYHEVKED